MKKQLLLAAISFLLIVSCSSDTDPIDEVGQDLEGSWAVTSYLDDGVEVFGVETVSLIMEFSNYNKDTNVGDFELESLDNDGTMEFLFGIYEVSNAGNSIIITSNNEDDYEGDTAPTLKLDLDGNDLRIEETKSDGSTEITFAVRQ